MKICLMCNKQFNINSFYSNGFDYKGKKKYKPNCKKCESSRKLNNYYKWLKEIVGELKCSICDYNKCTRALEFHHRDPREKEHNISTMKSHSFQNLKKEVDKCILVCSNCHREIHDGGLA